MRFYYGESTLLQVLDEAEFWKHQEAEHTVVIRQLVKNLESEFARQLQEFELAFNRTRGMVVRYIEAVIRSKGRLGPELKLQIRELVDYAQRQSGQFIRLLNRIAAGSEAVRGHPVAAVVINHIRRESEYFIGIVEAVLSRQNQEQPV